MPNTRENLIKLIDPVLRNLPWGEVSSQTAGDIADHLIANGVTVQGWISVEKKKQTNADCIRAMSDEELAAFMFSMVDCVSCQNKLMNNGKLVFGEERKTCTNKDYYAMCDGDGRKCESVCLEWLKQPAEETDNPK